MLTIAVSIRVSDRLRRDPAFVCTVFSNKSISSVERDFVKKVVLRLASNLEGHVQLS